jgi:hypothetical protein
MGVLGSRAHAQYRYFYFKDPVPLALDTERIAVQQSGEQAKRAATEGMPQFGIAATAVEKQAVDMWSYVNLPVAKKANAQIRDLSARIAAGGQVDFVSPVFMNAEGQSLFFTRRLHVGFDPSVETARAEAILKRFGAGVILDRDWSRMKGVYRLEAPSRDGFKVLEIANALAEHPDVRFAEPDMIAEVELSYTPNDPMFSSLWGIHNTGQSGGTADMDMDGPEAWDIEQGDSGVIVVVMDTGVQLDHPDLVAQVGYGEDFTGQGTGGAPGNQCDYHGTTTSGCVAATIDNNQGVVGICPHCTIASARVFVSNVPCSGFGSVSPTWVTNALEWAYDIGARVTTASIGMPSSGTLTTKFNTTRDDGIIHFTSSGNGGVGSIGYPGNVDSVNAVGALDRDGDRAGFSQYGPDLAYSAPGQSIRTTMWVDTYATVDGTSYASPYCAGVAGLYLSLEPALSPDLIDQVLQETAVDLDPPGWDEQFGWGFVNANNGLNWLQAPADPCDLGKITAGDAAADARFGWAVAMDDDVFVVGAPRDDELFADAGAAYVYRRSGTSWSFEQKLQASDAAADDNFGFAVGASGDVVAVGAFQNDGLAPDAGAVYVFRYNGASWVQEQKLTAADGASGDRMGYSVAVDGDVVVAGAYADDDAGSNSGSAYVFRWDDPTWVQEQKLVAADASSGDFFGWSVSVSGDYVATGAYLADVLDSNTGAVYVHEYDGSDWDNQSKVFPADGQASDSFGYAVAIDGDLMAVGAHVVDSHVDDSGALYMYRLVGHTWTMEQKLRASDGGENDRLGYQVALDGEVVIAGAFRNDEGGADAGAAYVYAYNGFRGYWGLEEKLVASDTFAGQQFGRAVATARGFGLVGVPFDADAGTDTGAAYLWAVGTDCNRNRTPDICDIRDGFSDDVDDDGVPDDCCPSAPIPTAILSATPTNRFISFDPGDGAQTTALRVTLVNVPGFGSFNGEHRWVDTPREISESSGSSGDDPPPTFWGANLRCTPVYRDWTGIDELFLFDEAIVPGGQYAVQAIAEGCDTATETWYTSSVSMSTTPVWGDPVGDCAVTPCTDPNGVVDFIDISAIVEKFKNEANAIVKVRADLAEDQPDGIVDFNDISRAVDAFQSDPYPFGGPQACPP